MPIRVQLSRKKGWRMPENTVKVSRPTAGGNPFVIGGWFKRFSNGWMRAMEGFQDGTYVRISDAREAVEWFEWYTTTWNPMVKAEKLKGLAGKNLACWCALDQPCHADVLLELANHEE